MAEFFPPVIFEVRAKVGEAIASFGEVNKELALMEKHGVLAGGSLGRLEKSAKLARTAFLGFAGAIAVVGVISLETLDKFEKAQTNLEVAVKNTGVNFEAAKPVISAHAEEMKNLGFSYTDTYEALSKMTAATGSPQIALDSLTTAADLARFSNISLADAGVLLAKASVGAGRGLLDMGIKMGVTLPKAFTLAQAIKAIETRTHGAAQAFKTTLGGGIAVAQANFQALEIKIGTDLLPTAIKFTDWISKTAIPKLGDLFGTIKNNIGWIKAFGIAMTAIWAANKIAAFITTLKVLIGVYRTLAATAGVAAIAEALATGGANLALGTAAITAAGLVVGAGGVSYLAYKAQHGADTTTGKTPYNPTSSNMPDVPNLAGKGVTRYSNNKPKKVAQTVTYNTFNINNPNPHATAQAVVKVQKFGAPISK